MSTEISLALARALLPERPEDAHKGTFGHVFVVGGARGLTGAVKLAGLAAARSGSGLVTVGVPRPLGDAFAVSLVEVMSYMLKSTESETLSADAVDDALVFAESKDAVVLGPGLSRHPEALAFVQEFVPRCPAPLVIDADGLNALCGRLDVLERAQAPIVLTPHPGEMARLVDSTVAAVQKDRETVAAEFAQRHGCVVVLKGKGTVVTEGPDQVYINTTGNSGMATGGTGDVLSGIVGSLLGQGLSAREAAMLGVYTHGLAGDLAAERHTARAMLAGDVIDALPAAWRALQPGL